MTDAREQLKDKCTKTGVSFAGMEHLVNYYIKHLKWDESKACDYAIGLIDEGTIANIRAIGGK